MYGLTNGGGTDQAGTIFEITPGGALTTLHSFDNIDGNSPHDGLLQRTNGTFYGTVSEPCSHAQKFPHPQVLLLDYAQGSSAIEAYWKSVAWPLQGVFVGEPLAAPFARR